MAKRKAKTKNAKTKKKAQTKKKAKKTRMKVLKMEKVEVNHTIEAPAKTTITEEPSSRGLIVSSISMVGRILSWPIRASLRLVKRSSKLNAVTHVMRRHLGFALLFAVLAGYAMSLMTAAMLFPASPLLALLVGVGGPVSILVLTASELGLAAALTTWAFIILLCTLASFVGEHVGVLISTRMRSKMRTQATEDFSAQFGTAVASS